MANRTGKKGKKPLQTTLGKASQNDKNVDLSHVQKPINTNVFGLRQVLSLFQTATKEVQSYITYECDILYECRTCRTIFRSLANFILHKRDYCQERFNHLDILNNNEDVDESICPENTQNIIFAESEPPDKTDVANTRKKSLLPVIEKLKEKQEISQLAQEVLNEDLSSKEMAQNSNKLDVTSKNNDLLLEQIATNNAAVFQTVLRSLPKRNTTNTTEFMKSEVMEIHGILENDEAVLGPDGKICTFESDKINKNPIIPKNDLFCTECNLKFSTKKTLTYHIKYKHNNTRLVYVCPDCKDTFANAWCVYRHLYKIHRKTSAQIKRLREQIHNSCIRKDQEPAKKKDKKYSDKMDKTDEENQWLCNIEGDNDFQMCGGCGKRFERKAALNSHAQMCTKRIAVCNTIKENNAKKKEEEICKDLKPKTTKAEKVEVLKGSSKRKPYLLRTYKSSEERSPDNVKVTTVEKNSDFCDVNANCEIVETNCDNNERTAEQDVTHKVRNSLSSEDGLSPSKSKDFVNSSYIEKIDTEKMFSIIGIPNNSESIEGENVTNSKSPENRSLISEDVSKESKFHTASDFDLFCQSVAQNLLTDSQEGAPGDMDDYTRKSPKVVPLILRRKNNSFKSGKKNAILEQHSQILPQNMLNINKLDINKEVSKDIENITQIDNSSETANSSSCSNFKISVKSLEDLIGVSPQHHKNADISDFGLTASNDILIKNKELDYMSIDNFTVPISSEISNTLRANISPEKLNEKYPKFLKRKRTSSFDFTECNKLSKSSKETPLSNNQDISFISRASPFMDQNKLLCIPCQATYPTLSKLLWHMSAHFSWFRFQCSRCSFISFNKQDCADHAKKNHFVKKASIQSVVLPIPNWKTVLMSHDFCMLNNENDLSGKHTDEILCGNPEEGSTVENIYEKVRINDYDEHEWTDGLFLESENADSEPLNDPLDSDILLGCTDNIKQENIDVIDDGQESFQIEVPQEIYTLNVSEIIEGVNYEERHHYPIQIKMEQVDDDEDIAMPNFISTHQNTDNTFTDEIKIVEEVILNEKPSEELLNEKNNETNNVESRECPKKLPELAVNMRPMRNRTRSIKTIQDDFFYDLSKVIKLNDTSVNKSNLQKHKKSVGNASQKNVRDSISSNGKGGSQQIRVYSKKK